mgnify:CR=1 FL=1
MINSSKKRKDFINPENAASFIPILISSFISILLTIFFVFPQYIKSNKVNLELNGLIKKKNELENLKSRYKKTNQEFENLTNEKVKIIELISGTSNLDTLLAKFGEIGNDNNIEFISIIPKKIEAFVPIKSSKKTNRNNQNLDVIIDPLLVEGTKKYIIDFTFKADFINLLSFLRELEFQENIILFRDINLKSKKVNTKSDESREMLDIKLSMTIYGKV